MKEFDIILAPVGSLRRKLAILLPAVDGDSVDGGREMLPETTLLNLNAEINAAWNSV